MAALLYDRKEYERAYVASKPIAERYEDASILHAKICIALRHYEEAKELLKRNVALERKADDSRYLLALSMVLSNDERAVGIIRDHLGEERYRRLKVLWEGTHR